MPVASGTIWHHYNKLEAELPGASSDCVPSRTIWAMRTLLLTRHAKSEWDDAVRETDHERRLNSRGCRDAPRMARHLDGQGLFPDLVVSSTAQRTRETVELMCAAVDGEPTIRFEDDLYLAAPEACLDVLRRSVAEFPATRCAMLVAHNPGLAELVGSFSGQPIAFPTAAVAAFQLSEQQAWEDLSIGGRISRPKLIGLWRPRELGSE